MDWIKDHIQLVIAAAAAFAYWLNARKQSQAEEEDAPPRTDFRDENAEAAAEAERARRIREEIRRKIAERAGGAPKPVEEPPLYRREPEPPPLYRREPQPVRETRPAVPESPAIDTGMLEKQRRLQEQLAELNRVRPRPEPILREGKTSGRQLAPATTSASRSLQTDLRQRGSLRRAIVLREVLGPPVGLR